MPAPFDFPSSTANINLPLLFTGQAQKEFFVNQGFSLIDALFHRSVISSIATPPADAEDGSAYRITGTASGDWAGREDSIAVRVASAWQFMTPVDGMWVFDRQIGQMLAFLGQWEIAASPAEPVGGSVIDTEARATLTALIGELTKLGLLT
jgi:hypothetical protein